MTRGHVESSTYRYGCHNRTRPTLDAQYYAQSGYKYDAIAMTRTPVIVAINSVFGPNTIACQYDASHTDKACGGCEHAKEAPNDGT